MIPSLCYHLTLTSVPHALTSSALARNNHHRQWCPSYQLRGPFSHASARSAWRSALFACLLQNASHSLPGPHSFLVLFPLSVSDSHPRFLLGEGVPQDSVPWRALSCSRYLWLLSHISAGEPRLITLASLLGWTSAFPTTLRAQHLDAPLSQCSKNKFPWDSICHDSGHILLLIININSISSLLSFEQFESRNPVWALCTKSITLNYMLNKYTLQLSSSVLSKK